MVQITSSFVATVLLVAPAVLAVPISQESFEARDVQHIHTGSSIPTAHHATAHHGSHPSTKHRPTPLRLSGREEAEEVNELSAREPTSRPSSAGSRRFGPKSVRGRLTHSGRFRTPRSGRFSAFRSGSRFRSPRLGGSRRLGGREDIDDVDELSAREPASGRMRPTIPRPSRSPVSGGSRIRSASSVRHSPGFRMHKFGRHRATRFGRPRFGGSRRLGDRDDVEEVEARDDVEEVEARDDVEEVEARDVEDLEEFLRREFEEMDERSVREWFSNLGKNIKKIFTGNKKPASSPTPPAAEAAVAARSEDVEMTELLERDVDLD